MHSSNGTQGKGIYVVKETSNASGMGGSGASEWNSFYDVLTKKYIGSTYEHY
jgi:hypothetical protein